MSIKAVMEKKVLIINNTSNGVYLFRRDLIKELLKDCNVVILSSDTGRISELPDMGCEMIITPIELHGTNVLKEFRLFCLLRKIIKRQNPTVVVTYTIKPNIYGGIACRILKMPYASNITGLGTVFEKKGLLQAIVKILYKYALGSARVVFFENSSNMEFFINERIINSKQAHLLPGAGVNIEYFTPKPYAHNECIHYLYVGRIVKDKGFEELIAASKRLLEEGKNLVLEVIGGLGEDYSELIAECESEGWMHYYGKQSDVRSFIASSDCIVLPSYHEGMSNTNLEGAASARPLITSDIPGCREAVVEGKSGLLCEPKSVDSLYETMKKMMQLSREEREQMGLAGRRHMEESFDKRRVVEMTIRHLF